MSWSVPVFRAFGIQVKVHIFFFIITIGLFLRQITLLQLDNVWWLDIFLLTVVVLFGSVLLHEFGHCFGARHVGGDAKEILIWPLGGLAYTDIPHRWKALFTTVAAGPAVNVVICVACAVVISGSGFLPSLNPLKEPYSTELTNYRDGRTYTSPYATQVYKAGTAEEPTRTEVNDRWREYEKKHGAVPRYTDTGPYAEAMQKMEFERTLAPVWVVWAQRIFWLNWILFLFNMIPAYPLDGGQLLQSLVWARTDHRRGVVIAAYTGFAVAILFLIVSIMANEALFLGLALFMLYSASLRLMQLDADEGPFGYDFSAGYTSLEKYDEEEAPRQKRPGFIRRWLDARRARRAAREAEAKQKEDERVDQLLEKIARSGKGSLTDEERRFLERVSSRRRNTP